LTNPKPDCGIGTKLPCGTVVAVKKDHVLLDTDEGVKEFSFSQIERFIYEQRSLSEA
jgi:hypothetical protein